MSISRFLRAAAVFGALAALPLAGCIKMSDTTVLQKDGTGTATITMAMDKAKIKELQDMAKAMGGEGGDEMSDEMDVEKIKEKMKGKDGVELVSAEKIDDEKSLGAKIVLKFKSLEHLYKAGVPGADGGKVTLAEKDGAWTLTREGKGGGMGDSGMEEVPEFMKSMFAGLDVQMSIQVPGTIVETNGQKNEAGNTVTWKMTDKDIGNKEAMKSLEKMSVTFKGEGLTLKAFSVTIEEDEDAPETMGEPEGEGGGKACGAGCGK